MTYILSLTRGLWPYLAALLAGLAVAGRLWWLKRTRAQARAQAETEGKRADAAEATVAVAVHVAERQAEGRVVAGEIETAARDAGPNPLDQIRAADRVRRAIAAKRVRR